MWEPMTTDRIAAQGFVYLWVDHVHHMFYLGSHKGAITDNYAHSSSRMPKFSMLSVPQGYRRIILAQGNYADMRQLEYQLLKSRHQNPLYHNVCANYPTGMCMDEQAMKNKSKKIKHHHADPAFRQKMKEVQRRLWSDPAYKQKIIEKMKLKWNNPSRKQKHMKTQKLIWSDPARRQKMKEMQRRLWSDPAYRHKHNETLKRQWSDPAHRQKHSERMKRRWSDPAYRQKMKEIMKAVARCQWSDPAHRQRISEQNRQYYADPIRKQKLSEAMKRHYADPANRQKQSERSKKGWQKRKLAEVPTRSTEGAVP